jgi:hypothetical protein
VAQIAAMRDAAQKQPSAQQLRAPDDAAALVGRDAKFTQGGAFNAEGPAGCMACADTDAVARGARIGCSDAARRAREAVAADEAAAADSGHHASTAELNEESVQDQQS